jgi:hypothetical protein
MVTCAIAAVAISCADAPDPKRLTKILAPSQTDFAVVSPFLERRCGSLDCHGSVGRPLRIFSGRGLRLPPERDAGAVYPGSSDTTESERNANYRSVIGLEPELMSRVEAGKASPRDLLLLQKPLGLGDPVAQHKGGQVLASQGDPGETCIVSWLTTGVDINACNLAASGF